MSFVTWDLSAIKKEYAAVLIKRLAIVNHKLFNLPDLPLDTHKIFRRLIVGVPGFEILLFRFSVEILFYF